MPHPSHSQQGALTIYMALVVAFVVLSSALLLSATLSRQLRLTGDIASSERAFAAANSGFEQGLFEALTIAPGEVVRGSGSINYDGEMATFEFAAEVFEQDATRVPCVLASGTFRAETRRLFTGPAECNLQ